MSVEVLEAPMIEARSDAAEAGACAVGGVAVAKCIECPAAASCWFMQQLQPRFEQPEEVIMKPTEQEGLLLSEYEDLLAPKDLPEFTYPSLGEEPSVAEEPKQPEAHREETVTLVSREVEWGVTPHDTPQTEVIMQEGGREAKELRRSEETSSYLEKLMDDTVDVVVAERFAQPVVSRMQKESHSLADNAATQEGVKRDAPAVGYQKTRDDEVEQVKDILPPVELPHIHEEPEVISETVPAPVLSDVEPNRPAELFTVAENTGEVAQELVFSEEPTAVQTTTYETDSAIEQLPFIEEEDEFAQSIVIEPLELKSVEERKEMQIPEAMETLPLEQDREPLVDHTVIIPDVPAEETMIAMEEESMAEQDAIKPETPLDEPLPRAQEVKEAPGHKKGVALAGAESILEATPGGDGDGLEEGEDDLAQHTSHDIVNTTTIENDDRKKDEYYARDDIKLENDNQHSREYDVLLHDSLDRITEQTPTVTIRSVPIGQGILRLVGMTVLRRLLGVEV